MLGVAIFLAGGGYHGCTQLCGCESGQMNGPPGEFQPWIGNAPGDLGLDLLLLLTGLPLLLDAGKQRIAGVDGCGGGWFLDGKILALLASFEKLLACLVFNPHSRLASLPTMLLSTMPLNVALLASANILALVPIILCCTLEPILVNGQLGNGCGGRRRTNRILHLWCNVGDVLYCLDDLSLSLNPYTSMLGLQMTIHMLGDDGMPALLAYCNSILWVMHKMLAEWIHGVLACL